MTSDFHRLRHWRRPLNGEGGNVRLRASCRGPFATRVGHCHSDPVAAARRPRYGHRMGQLTITVEPDGDGVWRIGAELRSDHFSGRGWCWGSPEALEDFAKDLTTFPLSAPAQLKLAYGEGCGDDLRLDVQVKQVSALGTIEARVEIADPDDPSCRLKAKLMTSYASLDRFVPQLTALAGGLRAAAVLSEG